MAKNDSLATYKARGSAGPLTFANWKGIGYFKQKATTVSNPNTDGQVNARARLALMVALFADFGNAVQTGFKEMAVKMSAYNAFVKYNINSALTYVSLGVYTTNWSTILFSKGTLGDTPILTGAGSAGTNNITLTYDTANAFYAQSSTDLAKVVCVNQTNEVISIVLNDGATRADGTIVFAPEGGINLADSFDVYLFFVKADNSKVSNSVHMNIVAGA